MVALAQITDEARRYYEGGKRASIGGIPCRMPAWHGQKTGADQIAKLAATGAHIEAGDLPGAPGFRFSRRTEARLYNGKPSSRGNAPGTVARSIRSTWYRPPALSLAPGYYVRLTDTPDELNDARRDWHEGNPKPLRDWLADTAGERRAYWAAYDAMNAPAPLALAA